MKNNEISIFFEITNACNHRCIHCCKYWEDNKCTRTASVETLNKIINLPKRSLTITGGEPGIAKDKVKYIIENEKMPITLNTNLTLWKKEELTYLEKHHVFLNVSAVSMLKNNYADITKADTYDKFMENLQSVSRDNVISFIVNNKSFKYINYNTKILLLMGFKNILVSPQSPTPYNSVNLEDIKEKILSLYNKYKSISNITTQGCIGTPVCDHECEAGLNRIMIDTLGDIYPCSPMGERKYKLGNIHDKNFDMYVVKQKGIEYYFSYPEKLRKICKGFVDTKQIY